MSVIPHTSFAQIQKGSAVVNQSGQKMTILGFSGRDNIEERLDDSNLRLRSELTDDESSKYVFGLYFNEKTPNRQELVIKKKQEMQVLTTLVNEDSQELALQSPFCDQDLIQYFLVLLKDLSVIKPEKFKNILICNYLIRGFSNVIAELKTEYVAVLKKLNLSQPVLT